MIVWLVASMIQRPNLKTSSQQMRAIDATIHRRRAIICGKNRAWKGKVNPYSNWVMIPFSTFLGMCIILILTCSTSFMVKSDEIRVVFLGFWRAQLGPTPHPGKRREFSPFSLNLCTLVIKLANSWGRVFWTHRMVHPRNRFCGFLWFILSGND